MQMYNTEHLQEKWGPILDFDGVDPIKDAHRRNVTAILLENQEKELREEVRIAKARQKDIKTFLRKKQKTANLLTNIRCITENNKIRNQN